MQRARVLDAVRAEAASRHGLVLVGGLPGLGVTRSLRRRLRAEGWLVEVRAGVVLVGGGSPSEWQKVVAASLAAGPMAALSHSTAARIHRFACMGPPDGSSPTEVTVQRGAAHPRLPGCILHRSVHLPERDVVTYRGVRVTSPIRTLIDLAPALPPRVLEKTVDEGRIAGLWDPPALVRAVEEASHRAGSVNLRIVVAARAGSGPVDSHLEVRVARVLAPLGPFETGYQLVLDGRVYILDQAWPSSRVGVECDGWWVRSRSRSKFDHDRRRNNHLAAHGWSVVHVTSAMTDEEILGAVAKVLLRSASGGA